MISWTDEAIEAAKRAYTDAANWPDTMRAALDAAAEAQTAAEFPGFKEWALEGEYHRGRAEALEEAARVADEYTHGNEDEYDYADIGKVVSAKAIAAAIRSRKD